MTRDNASLLAEVLMLYSAEIKTAEWVYCGWKGPEDASG